MAVPPRHFRWRGRESPLPRAFGTPPRAGHWPWRNAPRCFSAIQGGGPVGFDSHHPNAHINERPGPKSGLAFLLKVERVMGIEPTSEAWEASILPLNYTRNGGLTKIFKPPIISLEIMSSLDYDYTSGGPVNQVNNVGVLFLS